MAGIAAILMSRGGACAPSINSIWLCSIVCLLLGIPGAHSLLKNIYLTDRDVQILVTKTHIIRLIQIGQFDTNLQVTAVIKHPDIVEIIPETIVIPGFANPDTTVEVAHGITAYGKSAGHSEVTFTATPDGLVDLSSVFLRVAVMHSYVLSVISYIIGWLYFAAWSVSFYPQIYINFKRKSVVGLNFDFVALNILGFNMYSIFNCGLYFSKYIQNLYFERYPRGHNPVHLNDVFFSIHAACATLFTIGQCYRYERGNQRVSTTSRIIICVLGGIAIITALFAISDKITWLDFFYCCSYIKLATTLIKYMPQAYMNYKRKSTVGWSIGNILLDFTGGLLSILQMVLNAFNYNDWLSFFGDFTKFGLGLFSLLFDIFFILQHYVFYRKSRMPSSPVPQPPKILKTEEDQDPQIETPAVTKETP